MRNQKKERGRLMVCNQRTTPSQYRNKDKVKQRFINRVTDSLSATIDSLHKITHQLGLWFELVYYRINKRAQKKATVQYMNKALKHCHPLSESARIKLANRLKCNPEDLFRS